MSNNSKHTSEHELIPIYYQIVTSTHNDIVTEMFHKRIEHLVGKVTGTYTKLLSCVDIIRCTS